MSFISCIRVLICVHLLVVLFLISCYYPGAMFPFSPVALFLPQLLWWHRHSCVSFILFLWTVFIARFYRLLPQPLQLMILHFLTLACQIYGFYWVHFLLRCLRRTLRLAASGMWCERHIHSWAGFWTDSTCLRKPQASRRLHHRPWRIVSEVVIISFYTPQQSRTSCLRFPRFLAADRCSVVVLKFVCVHLCDGGCGRCVWIASPRLSGWRRPAGRSASRCCLSSVELHWSLLWVFAVDVHRLILLSAASGWFRLHEAGALCLICLVQSPSRKPLTLKYHTESTTCMSTCRHFSPCDLLLPLTWHSLRRLFQFCFLKWKKMCFLWVSHLRN